MRGPAAGVLLTAQATMPATPKAGEKQEVKKEP